MCTIRSSADYSSLVTASMGKTVTSPTIQPDRTKSKSLLKLKNVKIRMKRAKSRKC